MKPFLTFIISRLKIVCALTLFFALNACAQQQRLNVAIFVHEGVQLLDFSGPAEVFSDARSSKGSLFNVYTVAPTSDEITSQGFLKIKPQYSITNCPKPDIILLPGGDTGNPMADKNVIEWLKKSSTSTQYMISVCTGALLLAEAGLLKGKQATTHYCCREELGRYPDIKVINDVRFVDNGNIITTEGISAGIDGALYLVEKIAGLDVATETAKFMMYDWRRNEIEKIVIK